MNFFDNFLFVDYCKKLKLQKTSVKQLAKRQIQDTYISSDSYMVETIKNLEHMITATYKMYNGFLVTAGSGCGKTRLLIEIFKYYTRKEKNTIVLPITFKEDGIIAAHYPTHTELDVSVLKNQRKYFNDSNFRILY